LTYSTLKAFHSTAQGCPRLADYPGFARIVPVNPERVALLSRTLFNPYRVGALFSFETQGSPASRATLGWGVQLFQSNFDGEQQERFGHT